MNSHQADVDRGDRFEFAANWSRFLRLVDEKRNVTKRMADGRILFIAIYYDQGWPSRYWCVVKKLYNMSRIGRMAMIGLHIPNVYLARLLARNLRGQAESGRGMSLRCDMLDWLVGYPFEVAKPEAILEFIRPRGFELTNLSTYQGRYGCNEFVFWKVRPATS